MASTRDQCSLASTILVIELHLGEQQIVDDLGVRSSVTYIHVEKNPKYRLDGVPHNSHSVGMVS